MIDVEEEVRKLVAKRRVLSPSGDDGGPEFADHLRQQLRARAEQDAAIRSPRLGPTEPSIL